MLFQRMPGAIRAVFDAEMDVVARTDEVGLAWRSLENAHILSQPWPWPHTRTHLAMLTLALRTRDVREAVGQIIRILVAAPGSAAGRPPRGNTGRACIPMMRPMPVPVALAALLNEAGA